ncbi:MAG: hypothetical protein NTX03_06355 [Bacteroidetes bacterium]|nr:hypothetical protein [Bacteroidota bacterium]
MRTYLLKIPDNDYSLVTALLKRLGCIYHEINAEDLEDAKKCAKEPRISLEEVKKKIQSAK